MSDAEKKLAQAGDVVEYAGLDWVVEIAESRLGIMNYRIIELERNNSGREEPLTDVIGNRQFNENQATIKEKAGGEQQ